MVTKLSLKSMAFYGYHGVYSAEKELGQRIEVDVELITDLADAGRTDELKDTINYLDIYAIVKKIVTEGGFNLLEAIGNAIVAQISANFDLEQITVRVRKPNPPVGGFMEAIEFEAAAKLKK